MKRFLLIGCGYLGLRVARRLLEVGHSVSATTRKPSRAEQFRALGIDPVVCDVLDPASLRFPAADGAAHAVGLDRSAGVPMRAVYVDGLANAVRALPAATPFVHVSSTSVYGQADGQEVGDDGDTHPVEESGKVVLEAERMLRALRPDAAILRFAGIYGPGRLLRAAALRAGEALASDADGWLNLIHVEDGARAVAAALGHAPAGLTCNVCDSHPTTRRAFYTRLAQLLGAPPAAFSDAPAPEKSNRRIVGERLGHALGVRLDYPDYEAGLAASVDR